MHRYNTRRKTKYPQPVFPNAKALLEYQIQANQPSTSSTQNNPQNQIDQNLEIQNQVIEVAPNIEHIEQIDQLNNLVDQNIENMVDGPDNENQNPPDPNNPNEADNEAGEDNPNNVNEPQIDHNPDEIHNDVAYDHNGMVVFNDRQIANQIRDSFRELVNAAELKPPSYKQGQMQFNTFVNGVTDYCTTVNITGDARKKVLLKYLGNEERAAAHALDSPGITYDMLVQNLTERFGLTDNSDKARHLYNKLKMFSTESIEQYADRCRQLTNIAFKALAATDREGLILDRFKQGVSNPKMRQELIVANDVTLADAVKRALRIQEAKIYDSEGEIQAIEPQKFTARKCDICKKDNHTTDRCRFNDKNKPKYYCNNCKITGHSTERCRSKKDGNPQQENNQLKSDKDKILCLFCGKTGHFAANCFQLPKSQGNQPQRPRCHYCNKIGHLQKDCYARKNAAPKNEGGSLKDSQSN